MLNGLDLCTGIAGITEALSAWVRPVAYCEKNPHAQAILVSRIERGEVPNAPIWDDITTLRGSMLPRVDIVYGGFPCQSVSLAGRRLGLVSEQSGLFFHVARLVQETAPAFVFLENVWPGIRKFVPVVRGSLKSLGYECRDGVLSARDCGARHRRQRWFLLAHNNRAWKLQQARGQRKVRDGIIDSMEPRSTSDLADINRKSTKRFQSGRRTGPSGQEKIFVGGAVEAWRDTDTDSERMALCRPQERLIKKEPFGLDLLEGDDWDEYASFLLRVDSGLPYRGHRIKSLGNTNPPIQFEKAFKRLAGL